LNILSLKLLKKKVFSWSVFRHRKMKNVEKTQLKKSVRTLQNANNIKTARQKKNDGKKKKNLEH